MKKTPFVLALGILAASLSPAGAADFSLDGPITVNLANAGFRTGSRWRDSLIERTRQQPCSGENGCLAAIAALGQREFLNWPDAVERLKDLTRSEDLRVRVTALQALDNPLVTKFPDGRQIFIDAARAMESENPDVASRIVAIRALGGIESMASPDVRKDVLLRLAQEPQEDEDVRAAAIATLLGSRTIQVDTDVQDAMDELCLTEDFQPVAVRSAACDSAVGR